MDRYNRCSSFVIKRGMKTKQTEIHKLILLPQAKNNLAR